MYNKNRVMMTIRIRRRICWGYLQGGMMVLIILIMMVIIIAG